MNTFTKLTKRLILPALLLLGVITVQAQDEEEETGFSFSGSVDTYYRANLNAPNKVVDLDYDGDGVIDASGYTHPGTSFANLPGFSLGMVNLIASYEGEKVGFVGDLVFGPRGFEAVFGSPQIDGGFSSQIVNQLYTYWNVSDAVTLTLGNFNTFLGYEVISPTANYNYSTSYMFSYGPFSHTGLKADVALGDASLMLGVFNDTDVTEFNPTNHYYGGAQLGVGGQYLNLLFSDDYFQIDFTGGFDVSDATFLGINATYNNDNFIGTALYLQQSFTDDFSMGIRGEYFLDKGLGLLLEDDNVIDLTLSANYSVGSLTFIPEVRLDAYSDDYVLTEYTNPTDFKYGSSLASFVLAAVYSF